MEEILTLLSYFPTPMPREDDSKGLENGAGDNNCFVNVVIQSLWHLDSFRQKFNIMKREHRHVDPCAFCALEIIFTQYEFSDEAVIPPTALRQTMALLFKNSARFQMFELGDAAELFEALMGCLHDAFIGDCNNGLPKEKHSSLNHHGIECKDVNCVAHRVFGLNVTEKLKCKSCGIVSEPTASNMFVVYSYATELRNAYLQSPSSSFCRLLQLAGEDHRLCPNKEKCSNICVMTHSLKSIPDVFSAGIVWGPEPTVEEIDTVLRMLSLRIDLSNVFEVEDPKPCWYRFRGMICYYGKHYVAYFFNIKVRQWYVFDDTAVRAVGSDWATVRDRCLRGRLQPSVVFYEREDLDPIPQESYIAAQSSMPPPQSAMDAKELSSYVKISKIVHTDIEKEIKQSLREEGIYVPEESFIFVPSAHDDEEEVDILCVRTNWLYRRQSRRYRFKATNFMRVIPGTAEIKETFEYKDVFDITVTDKTNIIIRFYSGKEPQYIQSDRVEEIIALVTKRASRLNHTFPVKRV